jgi:hypothetical protein
MIEIQGIGFPFYPEFSSCGTRKPSHFSWTREKRDIQIYIDRSLSDGLYLKSHPRKYGWLLESKGVIADVFQHVVNNIPCYKNSYANIFTCDDNLVNLDSAFFLKSLPASNLPWTIGEECKIHAKTKRISMICSSVNMTSGHVRRLRWAEKLKSKVDMFGGACGSKQIGVLNGQHYHHKSKLEGIRDYMFSVAIENACYSDYFTEKITDCFATGTVPVYLGNPSIGRHFNTDGIIILDGKTEVDTLDHSVYSKKSEAIADNFERVRKMSMCEDDFFKRYIA